MTYQEFPLAPIRSGYANCTQTQRNGIYYEGDTVIITKSNSNPTGYSVRDYYGTVVASGSTSGTTLNLGSNWGPGWYRVYLTGAGSDSLYGTAYGSTSFGVLRVDSRFQPLPTTTKDVFGQLVPYGNGGANLGDPIELVTKGCLGIGTSRFVIPNTFDLVNGSPPGFNRLSDMVLSQQAVNIYWNHPNYLDPVRERKQWLAFDTATIDSIRLQPNYLDVALKDGMIDGSKVFVSAAPGGGAAGTDRIRVYYPNASTVVETYDVASQTAARAAINSGSNYIHVWSFEVNASPNAMAATAVGRTVRDAVVDVVSALYPLGCTHFEGPYNEPVLTGGVGDPSAAAVIAHRMKIFQQHVHEGDPNAKCMGPCIVDIVNPATETYLDAVVAGGWTPDAISFHDYNSITNGDMNLGRNSIENFISWLKERNLDGIERWQTEANYNMTARFGIAHHRSARNTMLHIELWEQYGVPSEQNPYWYDYSHGFWSTPFFLFNGYFGDHSANPPVVLMAVRAQEVYGRDFHHRIDFGCVPANNIFIGNVYGDATTGSVATLMMTSFIPGASVTLTVHGTAAALTVVSPFGVESTASQTSGRVTISVEDVPTYVRLPVGVNVSVYSVNDWGPTPLVSLTATRVSSAIGGVGSTVIADDRFLSVYDGSANPGVAHGGTMPSTAQIIFGSNISVERVIIWAGSAWQDQTTLFEYDIDTWNGSSWTTRKTVNKTRPTSFLHGSSDTGLGCQRETFWDEQWIEDVKLTSPVTCSGVRVAARAVSFGGEPDTSGAEYGGKQLGQGTTTPSLTIQEISVISPTVYTPPSAYAAVVLADSPIMFLKHDDTGSPGVDSSGNGLAPGYSGSFSLPAGLVTDGGKAFYSGLGGSSDGGIAVAHNALLNTGDTFTLECWFMSTYSTFADQTRYLHSKGSDSYQFRVHGRAFPTPTAYLELVQNGTGVVIATSSEDLSVGNIYHCVATKSGATTKIYLNGQDVTVPGTNATIGNNSGFFTSGFFGDQMQDCTAVYGTALSAARVLAHYIAGVAPAAPINSAVPTVYA